MAFDPRERTGPVVVGVEDAEDQQLVVRYAAGEAARNERRLHILHVAEPGQDETGRPRASEATESFAATAQTEFPEVDVQAEQVSGRPAATLVDRSVTASLLVVGHRGSGGFPRLPLGSVSLQLSTHAACPVIVLRPGRTRASTAGRIVVGTESPDALSDFTKRALDFAARAASRRGAPLELLHAAARPQLLNTGPAGLGRVAEGRAAFPEEQGLLEEQEPGLREDHPGLEVTSRVVEGRPASVLTGASEDAGLVVVGSHGRSGMRRFMLGSVSAEVLHTASCPVAVIPGAPPE